VRSSSDVRPPEGSNFRRVLEELQSLRSVQSVWTNVQALPTNTLMGRDSILFSGEVFLRQECAGAMNFFPPGAFGQSHPRLHAEVVQSISSFVPASARVVEFHAGVGSIGLALAARSSSVTSLVANEINPHGLSGLEKGIEENGLGAKVAIAAGTAGSHVGLLADADVVIVDPPRKGLEPELLRALLEVRPPRLIYLSCGLDSLLREVRALEQARFRPIHIAAYPYFPFTEHVETLMVFDSSAP
jgi:23S rRNA (uracil1939-C5)-methyltransferase